jgi:nucleotide-binding universal stress UspA family protein
MRKEVFTMYQKVLVPLDGSELAECVLPQVRNLARDGVVGEIILLNVVEVPSVWVAEGFDFITLKNNQMVAKQKYLAGLQSQLKSEGMKVNVEVLEGETSHSIIEYTKENHVDLIVIATHGYKGIKRVMFGSVALKVLHDAHVPVLLIRPDILGE